MSSIFENATLNKILDKHTYNINSSLYPISPQETIGSKIRNLRLNKGLTLKQFGKPLNKSFNTIANWEQGRRNPSKDILKHIISIYNLDEDYFDL